MPSIIPIFAVPFSALELADFAPLNRDVLHLLLSKETKEHANPSMSMERRAGLFESDFNLFSWPDAAIQALRSRIWHAVAGFVAELNGYDVATLNTMKINSHTWFHITRRGGHFGLHNHPMASVSGVYCVSPGESDANAKDSGALRFHNPMALANMFIDSGNAHSTSPYGTSPHTFNLKAGHLLLFPPWLQHEVLPFHGTGERVTIAFNCWFTKS